MGYFSGSKKISLWLLIFLPVMIAYGQQKLTEEQKIQRLISYVASLDKAVFIRNGSEYTAREASEHLSMKRNKAGGRIKTAEDFIIQIASRSSMSGRPYIIRMENGKEYPCEMLLRLELKRINGQNR